MSGWVYGKKSKKVVKLRNFVVSAALFKGQEILWPLKTGEARKKPREEKQEETKVSLRLGMK